MSKLFGGTQSGLTRLTEMMDNLDMDFESFYGTPFFRKSSFSESVETTNDRYTVTVEIPGVKLDAVDVQLTGLILSIEATTRNGQLKRRYSLPPDADRDAVEATLDLGVLTVTIPRKSNTSVSPKKVVVKSS